MSDKQKKYNSELSTWGVYVLLHVKQEFLGNEWHEECAMIDNAIDSLNKYLGEGFELPKKLYEGWQQDYVNSFRKFGFGGMVASANFPYYVQACKEHVLCP